MLDLISNYLQTQGAGIVGQTIFEGQQPQDIDDCITLFQTGGYAPEVGINIERPTFQIIVRNCDYETARIKINEVFKLLHGDASIFLLIKASQSPASIGEDEKGRFEWSVNFEVIKQYF